MFHSTLAAARNYAALPKVTCPECDGEGWLLYEITPNHPSGRMGIETCGVCCGSGQVVEDGQ